MTLPPLVDDSRTRGERAARLGNSRVSDYDIVQGVW